MKKTLKLVAVDTVLLVGSVLLSLFLVFGHIHDTNYWLQFVLVFLPIICLLAVKFYKVRISNSSLEIVKLCLVGMVPVYTVIWIVAGFIYGFLDLICRWIIVYGIISFCAVVGVRYIYRCIVEIYYASDKDKNYLHAIIYGAGETGSTMARLAKKGLFEYKIEGFIDDNDGLRHELVMGYPVLGNIDEAEEIFAKYQGVVTVLVIAITLISREQIQKISIAAKKYGMSVKIVPHLFETKQAGDVSVRDIDYADLLGRSLITTDKDVLFNMFQGKRILVTGAGGSIGSEICRQLIEFGPSSLIVLDIDETELHDLCLRLLDYEQEWSDKIIPVVCDIKNGKKISYIFDKYKPDIVFHAAAYKHVPLMELYPEEAILTNITGSYNVFKAAGESGVNRVVVISTDKAVNPTNVMGATKRVVEILARAFNRFSNTDFCCVRFGNVIGSRGSMLPLFLEEIKAGRPITVTDRNIIRYFMAIPEAVSLVFMAATIANGGEVMVLDMGQPVNIYEFAQRLIDLFGDGRSEIKVTGLRPGEKMYEELLADKDKTIPTSNSKIFKAKVVKDESLSLESMESLVESLKTMSPDELVGKLKILVPEFKRATNNGESDNEN